MLFPVSLVVIAAAWLDGALVGAGPSVMPTFDDPTSFLQGGEQHDGTPHSCCA